MIDIDVYRVLRPESRRWWKRTWQAEWTGCAWCPRTFTKIGAHHKALRWSRWSLRRQRLYVRRRRFFRRWWIKLQTTAKFWQCKPCNGKGWAWDQSEQIDCPACGGTGRARKP